VSKIPVSPAATDYTPAIAQVQAARALAVLVGLAPDQTARFIQTASQNGVTAPVGTPAPP
jgi:ABC-type branched-subunit amino acid transport system substrate-binding protein